MRTVDDFARIRQAHREGLSSRQIAAQLGVGRDTVRKALENAEPTPYKLSAPRPAPVFGPFRQFVDAMLVQDETAPRKQRHTASQVYQRLVAEHCWIDSRTSVTRNLEKPSLIPDRLISRDHLLPPIAHGRHRR